MIPQRVLCPTSATWHGRHYVTDRRWRIVAPEGAEPVLCSAACVLSWLVYGLPADLAAATANSGGTVEGDTSTRTREAA
jgi:hypothetical protein